MVERNAHAVDPMCSIRISAEDAAPAARILRAAVKTGAPGGRLRVRLPGAAVDAVTLMLISIPAIYHTSAVTCTYTVSLNCLIGNGLNLQRHACVTRHDGS